ncbi:MAG: glycosyltransferase family 2 protein [Bdellovibrionales bacterium]|nr:glycosyltransferase family 2 protein [Bdellovibrionales bacterium]
MTSQAKPISGKAPLSLKNSFVSVVVPVFNEKSAIAENLDLLVSEIEEHFERFEVIVVSDGSTDGTNLELARFVDPHVRFKIITENQGKGYSVREGFKEAKGDYIFFIDGGMELHPKELKVFIGLMALYDADIVIGSKRHPQSQVYYPWYRRLLSVIFQVFVQWLFHVNVSDSQVGIKLFKKAVLVDVLPYLEINRYGFDLELLSLAQLMGHKEILEAPVRLDYFVSRRSTLRDVLHVFRMGFSLLKETLALYFKIRRIRGELKAVP